MRESASAVVDMSGVASMRIAMLAFLSLLSCGSAPAQKGKSAQPASPPTGAKIESSGFATILFAPPEPYPDAPPPIPGEQETQRLARTMGISVSTAERLMNPDSATTRAAIALDRRLKEGAAGNYVSTKIIRDPKPRYVFYFRRMAAATLARFTSDERFQAVEGGIPARELDPLLQSWMARLGKHRLGTSGSVDPFEGVVELDVGVSRPEYETIAAKEGWTLPPQVRLKFAVGIDPAKVVAPDAVPFIRAFPRADRSPGIILESATAGRIVLRDGCFRLGDGSEGVPLVLFGRDTRLYRDAGGYLTVASLQNPDSRGRIGEEMIWGGYPAPVEEEAGVKALRAQCGGGPIASVGEPTSASLFRVRPGAVASYAEVKRISRQRAWNEIRACWAEQDSQRARDGQRRPMRPCDSPFQIHPPPPPQPRN
jgi:hypothetical protein